METMKAPLAPASETTPIHPLWLRITHWLNALAALILMMLSGWRIYDASPVFQGFVIPPGITLGGWLGGALQWHFAAMWLLVFNGLFYLAMNLATGRFVRKFLPVSPRAVLRDLVAALSGKLSHADLRHYNAVQKFAYLFVDRRSDRARAVGARDLEVGAVSAAARTDGRLRQRAHRPLLRDGADGWRSSSCIWRWSRSCRARCSR